MPFSKGIRKSKWYVHRVLCDDNEVYRINTVDESIECYEIPDVKNDC
jgi:hypothetical protein